MFISKLSSVLLWLSFSAAAADDPCAFFLGVDKLDDIVFHRVSYIEDMRAVTQKLVLEHTITAEQAEVAFAENILGHFAPIFQEFTLAELRARGFADHEVKNFVRHFGNVFTSEHQMQFARDVTRVMLLTLSEAPSPANPLDFKKFMQTASYFGVSPDLFGQFLRVWAYVRQAHPATILHFVLANIQNAGESFGDPRPRFWRFNTRRARAATPDFIQKARDFVRMAENKSFWDRAQDRDALDPADFRQRFLAVPLFARDFVVRHKLKSLGFAQVQALLREPLARPTLVELEMLERDFTRLHELVRQAGVEKSNALDNARREIQRLDARDALPSIRLEFAFSLRQNSLGQGISPEKMAELCVDEVWGRVSHHRRAAPHSEFFVWFATEILRSNKSNSQFRRLEVGICLALMKLALKYDLSREQVGHIHSFIDSWPIPEFRHVENWMNPSPYPAKELLQKYPSYRDAIANLKSFLTEHGQIFTTLEELSVELNRRLE